MPRFKIGDSVRAIKIGTITQIKDDALFPIGIDFGNDSYLWGYAYEFELISDTPTDITKEIISPCSKWWHAMVEILEKNFPKGECKERGAALCMLAMIEFLLNHGEEKFKENFGELLER